MSPYYSDGLVTLYHGDCWEILPQLTGDFAVVSDPPYGMDWDADTTRFSGGQLGGAKRGSKRDRVRGDAAPFDPAPFLTYASCVLWGVNHFAQRVPVGTWLVWVKKPVRRYGTFLSDAEVAWMKGGHGIYLKELHWGGITRSEERGQHLHPTQKPASIMSWCIEKGAAPGLTILDPFCGSGPTLQAAKTLGRRAIGIEIDERYCFTAAERCRQEVLELGA